ncbi:DUF1492 domain-containing protein [Paenibacillus sp. L3-i20]|uniref:DUF1492 domain-containing protein n=1 Tax=Paenibacillus sp. L3-i20 TaxID=2905833 RepID=UPI001EDDBD88|nr:DUF1492 domain-containing protein [Paenibacillus sp. L3-i20]GKU75662.1 hypothetical protein L3i20_v200590 [Paenibacillus sp. L3-i20]
MTEQQVIDQLNQYRQLKARIQVLSTYNIGSGITVSRLNQDDQLQELHSRLRGMPSYMYLSAKEQKLETVAHAYLKQYPAGIKSQLKAIPLEGNDVEDDKLLKELRGKIDNVIKARGYGIRDDIDMVLDRLSELQDLQEQLQKVDNVLVALEEYKPDYSKLLRLKYIESKSVDETCYQLSIVKQTYIRWRTKAISEYIKLSC